MLVELEEGEEGVDVWAPHVTEMEADVLRGCQRQRGVVKSVPRWTKQHRSCLGAKSERF